MSKIISLFRRSLLLLLTIVFLYGCASSESKKEAYYDKFDDQQMYAMAIKDIKSKHYVKAVESLEALDARYPFGDYADKAQLLIIYAYYEADDYPSALASAERFIRVHPRHESVDYAYYMRGLVNFHEALGFVDRYLPMDRKDRDQTAAKKSYADFTSLVDRFPKSNYVADAEKRMIYLRNIIAQNELAAARYYMKRGAYVAAANRGSYVLENFDQSPAMEEALAIMVEAYRKLAMNDLADSTLVVLKQNFPNSKYLNRLA